MFSYVACVTMSSLCTMSISNSNSDKLLTLDHETAGISRFYNTGLLGITVKNYTPFAQPTVVPLVIISKIISLQKVYRTYFPPFSSSFLTYSEIIPT